MGADTLTSMAWLEASADFILAYLPAGKQVAEYTFQREAGGVIAQGGFRETSPEVISAAGTADVQQLQDLLQQKERLKANDDLEGIALTLKIKDDASFIYSTRTYDEGSAYLLQIMWGVLKPKQQESDTNDFILEVWALAGLAGYSGI